MCRGQHVSLSILAESKFWSENKYSPMWWRLKSFNLFTCQYRWWALSKTAHQAHLFSVSASKDWSAQDFFLFVWGVFKKEFLKCQKLLFEKPSNKHCVKTRPNFLGLICSICSKPAANWCCSIVLLVYKTTWAIPISLVVTVSDNE